MDGIEVLLLRRKLAEHETRLHNFLLNAQLSISVGTRELYAKLAETERLLVSSVRLELEAVCRMRIGTLVQGNGHDYVAGE